MTFYLINILLFFLYSAFFITIKIFNKQIYYLISILHFSLIMGLRSYTVGTDTFQYVSYYLEGISNSNGSWLYTLLNKIVWNLVGSNYHIFILVLSFLTVYLIYKSIILFGGGEKKFFLSFSIYLTYYYYFESFNMQRQMLAVAMVMYSMALLQKDKKLLSILFFVMAIGIHNTAIVAIVGYLVLKIRKTGRNLLIISLSVVFGVSLSGKLLSIFSNISSHYSMYENYLSNSRYAAGGGSILLGVFFILITIFTVVFTNVLNDDKNGFLLFMTQIGGLLYIIGGHSQLLVRIAVYFAIYSIISLPISIECIAGRFSEYKMMRFVLSSVTLSLGILLLVYKLSNNFGEILPYVFIK